MIINTLTINGNTFEIADPAVEPLAQTVAQLNEISTATSTAVKQLQDDADTAQQNIDRLIEEQKNCVSTVEQTLTDAQQAQARANIGAVEQTAYGIVVKGQQTQISLDIFANTDDSGFDHPAAGFYGDSDQFVRLTHIADGVSEYDAATVGQLNELSSTASEAINNLTQATDKFQQDVGTNRENIEKLQPYVIELVLDGDPYVEGFVFSGDFQWDELVEAAQSGRNVVCRMMWEGVNDFSLSHIDEYEALFIQHLEDARRFVLIDHNGKITWYTIPITTDTTLSESGVPADARVVGNKLGDIETALDSIIDMQKRLIGESITFICCGNSFTAIYGMIWSQWCDSQYNTDGIYVGEDGLVYDGAGDPIVLVGADPQTGTMVIADGAEYTSL